MVPANQGSRGALVTWTVVTTILFVTATVFAIYYYVEADRVAKSAADTATKFREVVSEGQLTNTELLEPLKAIRSAENAEQMGFNSSMSYLEVALKQRDELAKRIAVSPDYTKATQAADRVLADAAQKAQLAGLGKVPGGSLNEAVTGLADALVTRSNEVASLRGDLETAQRSQQEAAKQLAIARDAMDKQLAAVRESEQTTLTSSQSDRQSKDQQIAQLTGEFQQQLDAAQAAATESQTKLADEQRATAQLRDEISKLQGRLSGMRANTGDSVVRQPDGRIVRVPTSDSVYIDLGQGDHISPGLTFQVYDKTEGVPAAGDSGTNDNLPTGKASIEVVRVGPTSSECRVVRLQPGQTLIEGDLVANLIYDRNARSNFLVFGNFDLDRNNVATANDTEIIKRLVTQWGGSLVDKVNVDTDFVVLGAEPVLPTFTREELVDPINLSKLNEARGEANAYDEVRRLAQEYNIPILNQNRFLYFVGFYELSRR